MRQVHSQTHIAKIVQMLLLLAVAYGGLADAIGRPQGTWLARLSGTREERPAGELSVCDSSSSGQKPLADGSSAQKKQCTSDLHAQGFRSCICAVRSAPQALPSLLVRKAHHKTSQQANQPPQDRPL